MPGAVLGTRPRERTREESGEMGIIGGYIIETGGLGAGVEDRVEGITDGMAEGSVIGLIV
jgi:hypothetical protein